MIKSILKPLTFALGFLLSTTMYGQTGVFTHSGASAGNPAGVTTGDFSFNSAGTKILDGYDNANSVNTWSAPVALGFSFDLAGTAVSSFCVSKNGMITFDTTVALAVVDTSITSGAKSIPHSAVPNNTVMMWSPFTTYGSGTYQGTLGSNDDVYSNTYGTAPTRIHYVTWHSFEISNCSYAYFSIAFEETSNKVYFIDPHYRSSTGGSWPMTVGVQSSSTTAYAVSGSPDTSLCLTVGSSSYTDNSYYDFAYGTCFGASGLNTSGATPTSFTANWTSNNSSPIYSEVRYRVAGTTSNTTIVGSATSASITGLFPATTYEWEVREACSVGDTTAWSPPNSITLQVCAATSQCQYMVYMTDAYGDGWNGNKLIFSQSGVAVGTLGAGFATGSAFTDSISLCDMTSAAVTLDLGSWSGEIGFDVVGPYGDTVLTHTSGTTLTTGYSFGSFLAYCSSCAIVTSLPYTENFDNTTSWVVPALGYNGVFDDCWTPTPSTGFVYRWVSSTGGTPSGLTGPLSGSGGAGQYIYTESSYGTAGAIATVEMPNMQLTDSLLVFSFDYHMTGSTMGNLYAEYDAGSGWVTFDSIIGQQQTSQSAAWITHNSLLTNPTGVFNIRLRGVRGASFTGDIAFDNASVDVLACMDPSGLSASNVSNTSFDVAWSSINSSPLSYEVRYRSTGATTYMSNGASASIAGLTAGTSYDVSVREICAVGDTSGWSADLTVSTLLCAAADQCQYMVYMTDAYGDGWNGNKLVFTQSGVAIGTLGAGFATGSAFTDSISLCDMTSAAVTLDLGSWSSEIGFDVVGPYGDTLLSHTAGSTLISGYSFGSFLAWCSSCPLVTSLPWADNLDSTLILNSCWNFSSVSGGPSWYTSSAGTPSSGTGPLSGSGGTGQYIFLETSTAVAGNYQSATATLPMMSVSDTAIVMSFDYHMYGADMGTLFVEQYDGTTWNIVDSISGQQQGIQTDPWMTHNALISHSGTGMLELRLRGKKLAGYTSDMALDNVSVDVLSCMDPTGLSASNITESSFDVAWTSINTPLSYEVRYRSTGGTTYMSNGASSSIAGLAAATSYDVSVREICAVGDTSGWSADLVVSTMVCAAADQCGYIVYMTDSYGDGWNGNSLNFVQSGTVVGTTGVNFATGSALTDTVMLCSQDSASVLLNLGSWSSEIGLDVTNLNGDTLVSHTAGTTLTNAYNFGTFYADCRTPATYTVSVNMAKESIHPSGVRIAGNFQGWNPATTAMADPDGDGIYEYTINTFLGEHLEYKFINGAAWGSDESVPNDCRYNGSWNRGDSVANLADTAAVVCFAACTDCQINVTFSVNMAWEVANGIVSGDSVHVAGSFQGWDPAVTVMLDTNANGIYEVTATMPINSKIYYKYINGKTWNDAEASGDLSACGEDDGVGGNNRVDSLGVTDTVLGVVCFTKCYDCSVGLPEPMAGITLYPNPTVGEFTLERSELAGDVEVTVVDMQGQLLRATEWAAGQAELDMDLSDMASGVYMIRLNADEGARTMRVAIQR